MQLFLIFIACLHAIDAKNFQLDLKCGYLNSNPKFTKINVFDKWCYFVVDGATRRANPNISPTHYVFDIEKARDECKNANATLPIIKSEEENSFLYKYLITHDEDNSIDMALGLKQHKDSTGYKYTWDDGSPLTYHPAFIYSTFWYGKNDSALYTEAMAILDPNPWYNVDVIEPRDTRVRVVCKAPARPSLTRSVCMNPNKVVQLWRSEIFNDESCYFDIKNAIKESNVKREDKYIFNIINARKLCMSYDAYLPSISNHDESAWFVTKFSQNNRLVAALGLVQREAHPFYNYLWSDGSIFDYEANWPTKYQKALYTKIVAPNKPQTVYWKNARKGDEEDYEVQVVCKQSIQTPNTITSTSIKESKCRSGRGSEEATTVVFENRFCYFAVQLLDETFDIWKGRQLCQNEGATLLTIESKDEYEFIIFSFNNTNFFLFGNISYVALGLRQISSIYDYKWDNGNQITYEPSKWIGKNMYAYFTLLSLSSFAWKSIENSSLVSQIGVVCKQPHSSITTAAPTSSSIPTTTLLFSVTTGTSRQTVQIGNQCSIQNKVQHAKVAIDDENKLCYFIVPDASANLNKGKFDAYAARKLCAQYNATLPIIYHKQEAEFILSNFRSNHFDDGLCVGIALGINIKAKFNLDPKSEWYRKKIPEYKWQDKTPVSYKPVIWQEPHDWTHVKASESFVYMRFTPRDEIVWETVVKLRTSFNQETPYICVLCQQQLSKRALKSRQDVGNIGIKNCFTLTNVLITYTVMAFSVYNHI